MREVSVVPLTKAGFAPYGDVVEIEGADVITINQGFALRANGLAQVDLANEGPPNISLFLAKARTSSIDIRLMERHPLGSQLFVPLQNIPWVVVVCSDPRIPASFRAFMASGRQGVNYARNVWHHPLLALRDQQRFLVVDNPEPANLEEVRLEEQCCFQISANLSGTNDGRLSSQDLDGPRRSK